MHVGCYGIFMNILRTHPQLLQYVHGVMWLGLKKCTTSIIIDISGVGGAPAVLVPSLT